MPDELLLYRSLQQDLFAGQSAARKDKPHCRANSGNKTSYSNVDTEVYPDMGISFLHFVGKFSQQSPARSHSTWICIQKGYKGCENIRIGVVTVINKKFQEEPKHEN